MSKVYFTNKITSESLVKIFNALNIELKGKIGIKISSGELGGHNYLKPELIKDLVNKLNGTLIECCTAYEGKRTNPTDHYEVIKAHGFDKFNFDLMDENGEFTLKINNGFHLKENIVGENLKKYQSLVILSHFKGHAMGGFGGALKNMSIGIASPNGKANIHTAGKVKDPAILWSNLPKQDEFLESMADACKSIIEYIGKENIVYINVANNLSIDCDCDRDPEKPKMKDIGIFAAIDPVAIDQACYDAIVNSKDEGKKDLVNRMTTLHAIHTVEASEQLGLGSRKYEIINID